jgi:hypothetical protein
MFQLAVIVYLSKTYRFVVCINVQSNLGDSLKLNKVLILSDAISLNKGAFFDGNS